MNWHNRFHAWNGIMTSLINNHKKHSGDINFLLMLVTATLILDPVLFLYGVLPFPYIFLALPMIAATMVTAIMHDTERN